VAFIALLQVFDDSTHFRRILQDEEEVDNFESFYDFKAVYNKNYGHESEFSKFNTFKKNVDFIDQF